MPGAANYRNSRRATPQSTNGHAGANVSTNADWHAEVPAPAGKGMTIELIQKAGRHRCVQGLVCDSVCQSVTADTVEFYVHPAVRSANTVV